MKRGTQEYKEAQRERERKYAQTSKALAKRRRYESTPHGRTMKLIQEARGRAKRGSLDFSISIEDVQPLPTHCPVLGLELDYRHKSDGKRSHNSPSLDRINPTKGYIKGNVRIISWRANDLKADGTPAELSLVAADANKIENP